MNCERAGIRGILVGEALMKAKCVTFFVNELLGRPSFMVKVVENMHSDKILRKVCGITTINDAILCAKNGADMIGT